MAVAGDFVFLEHLADRGLLRSLGRVLVMNLLENGYDPIRALEGALSLVAPGGSLVIAASPGYRWSIQPAGVASAI